MKRIILATLGLILILGVTVFTLTGEPTTIHKDLGGISGVEGPTTRNYDRCDVQCVGDTEEYRSMCLPSGADKCSPKYCGG